MTTVVGSMASPRWVECPKWTVKAGFGSVEPGGIQLPGWHVGQFVRIVLQNRFSRLPLLGKFDSDCGRDWRTSCNVFRSSFLLFHLFSFVYVYTGLKPLPGLGFSRLR